MKAYVLIGSFGALGVFSSEEDAWSAIQKIKTRSAKQLERYHEREHQREEYLNRFEPAKVHPPTSQDATSPFPNGFRQYTNAQYHEADLACGPRPDLTPDCDEYRVECFTLDAIEPARVIRVTPSVSTAAATLDA